MKAGRIDEHDKAPNRQGDTADKPHEKSREGPARVSHELDKQQDWDKAAEDRGFQKGDQGGYKGDYDQGKYETGDFGFPRTAGAEPDTGAGPAPAKPGSPKDERKK